VLKKHCPGYLQDPRNLFHVHKHVMGDYMPKAGKDWHFIDRKEADAATEAETPKDTD
jgi:hypothetical protein